MVQCSSISLVYSGLVTAKTIKPEQMSPYIIANYINNSDLCKFFLNKTKRACQISGTPSCVND